MELEDRQQLLDITHQGKRYVIAGGKWRQQRDEERRAARLEKAQKELKRLAAVKRKRVNAQKLSSQVGRALQRLKAHKYFAYQVDEPFCQIKSYLEVRPIFHWRADRVVNHVRLCFLAYWLSARLGKEWRAKGESQEVPRVLRQLQTIRVGTLRLGETLCPRMMTDVPKDLNAQLKKLGLTHVFAAPP